MSLGVTTHLTASPMGCSLKRHLRVDVIRLMVDWRKRVIGEGWAGGELV
jgi:hypothetical protein